MTGQFPKVPKARKRRSSRITAYRSNLFTQPESTDSLQTIIDCDPEKMERGQFVNYFNALVNIIKDEKFSSDTKGKISEETESAFKKFEETMTVLKDRYIRQLIEAAYCVHEKKFDDLTNTQRDLYYSRVTGFLRELREGKSSCCVIL